VVGVKNRSPSGGVFGQSIGLGPVEPSELSRVDTSIARSAGPGKEQRLILRTTVYYIF